MTGNAPIQSTRVGCITFDIPRGRGGLEFYHSTLDKCIRSEQALKVALAEMPPQQSICREKKVGSQAHDLCETSVLRAVLEAGLIHR